MNLKNKIFKYLSTAPTLRIVLQTSGFMPEKPKEDSDSDFLQFSQNSTNFNFNNEWKNSFGQNTTPPTDSKTSLKRFIRRVRKII